ncbi:MAG TPA: cation transporter [Bacteroides sp.]|nr:cation transporter [Bacteroides sp.]
MENHIGSIIKASWVGVLGNALLSVLKIVVGILSGSLAVVADGIDSASDILTSLIILFTARIMKRPPDIKYPYGYLKADTIATKALAFVILFAGAQLAISTIRNFMLGEERGMPRMIAIYVTLISIAGKFLLARHQLRIGKRSNSEMLKANARNMQNDVMISISVLVGLTFTFILKMPILDSVTALIVSVWILKVGFQIFMQTNRDLMDANTEPELYSKVFAAVDRVEGAGNPHRLRIRKIGNYLMIVLDIEVDGSLSTLESHKICVAVENSIRSDIENVFDIMIHIEPEGFKHIEEVYGLSPSDLDTI